MRRTTALAGGHGHRAYRVNKASTPIACIALVAIVGVIAVTAAFLIISPAIIRLIGKSGIHVVTQVMGLIMCVIGIQFIINGIRPVVIEILSSVR